MNDQQNCLCLPGNTITVNSQTYKIIRWFSFVMMLTVVISCSNPAGRSNVAERPNILLIVADDLGYADLGCYGGDIETPNIDSLAARGIRFSRFHTSPLCAPTRAMLLSGNDNHIAGMGNMLEFNDDFGYEGHLTNRIVTIPAVLRDAGYHIYMAGKWHLGADSISNPQCKGFEHSFVNLYGAGNHYNDLGFETLYPVTRYTENGKPATWKEGNYSTDFYTDKIIEFINLHQEDKKPFFAFATYTSPHWPLQVDEKYWKKYAGRYDSGYDVLREKRLASLKQAGMIPTDAVLPELHKNIRPWRTLSESEKKTEARKMELYAGMVDNLDVNVGRLIRHLKDIGAYDNTIIVFMSDNGAAAEDFYNNPYFEPFLHQYYSNDYDNMGKANSFVSYGPAWAEAGTSPFRDFKGYTTEGGINTPMIICGPNVAHKNKVSDEFVTLMDLAPTFYEATQTLYPAIYEGHNVYPLRGTSLLSFLSGKSSQVHDSTYVFGLEHDRFAMIRKGKWKITNTETPFVEENFKLYDLSLDLAEMHDLKAANPVKYKEMIGEWQKFSKEIKANMRSSGGE